MKTSQNRKVIALHMLAIFSSIVFFYSCASTSVATYPREGWKISTPEDQGIRSEMLSEMIEEIRETDYDIHSILIVRNGCMILDAYFWPFSKGQKHNLHSCTKSIMSLLIGIAIDKGYILNVDQPIMGFFPDRQFANMDDLKKSITLEDLLMMASGLKCRDSFHHNNAGLFEMRNTTDWAKYVLDLPMAGNPGETFEYCNGASYLLSAIIQNTTGMRSLEFATKNLFQPLGITDVAWETNSQGVDIGYGEMWLKPHDMAKIGLLYLNKGQWGNKQIVPAAWVEASTYGHIDVNWFDQYGYQWWVCLDGYYMAIGWGGQYIFVVPDKDMVVVFTSDLPFRSLYFPRRLLVEYIVPTGVSSEALPPNPLEKARLDDLIASISTAPPRGFIWTSEEEGVARDGVFERSSSPSFKFEYPPGCRKKALEDPGEVMRMKTPEEVPFGAYVGDIPDGIELEDFARTFYAQKLEDVGSHIEIVSNEEITLKCGTEAYRTDITWMYKDAIPITTHLVSAYKNGKCIFVAVHPLRDHNKFESIVRSLTFK